jgi:predicted glycosyltransferase/aminoglycoside phosphotransferase (APT) family kinase protein
VTTRVALAPDPLVPQRDELLDERRLAALLGAERVELVRVKYRVGRGLGLVLRVHVAGRTHLLSARSFQPGEGLRNFERALHRAPGTVGPLPAVSFAPDVETVFWTFPHDRRIGSLAILEGGNEDLARVAGAPCRPFLAAYVPEKAATARCVDAQGRILAYGKVYGDGEVAKLAFATHAALLAPLASGVAAPPVPRALAHDAALGAIVIEPVDGEALNTDTSNASPAAFAALGAALATLHRGPAPPLADFERLTPAQLAHAAKLIGRVRPDVALDAAKLADALASSYDDAEERVCLHGDAHPKNAILGSAGLALVDLDQAALGPPAADLGGLLGGLRYQRCVGALSAARERALGDELLAGYGAVREPPSARSLAWHTAAALLAERGLRAVTRVRPDGLERLDEIIAAAREEYRPHRTRKGPPGKPVLLMHCQHAVGLGHLTRSLALAAALAEPFRVVVLCGGAVPPHVSPAAGLEVVQLPPLSRDREGRVVSVDERYTLERARELRTELLVDAARALRPAVVVAELFPFGRRAFAGEIQALIDEGRAHPARPALVACSVRDILVGRGAEQPAFDERACALANAHFDAILVHSDPRFARLEESFRPRTPLRSPVYHTGFVTNGASAGPAPAARAPRVIVSAGGGSVGESLLHAALDAQPSLWRDDGLAMRVIAGPFLAGEKWQELRARAAGHDGIELVRSVPDLPAELRSATVSVSQCGYNTALDILRARVPALVVPYFAPGEDEQTRRAQRLVERGAVRALAPDGLDGRALAREVRTLRHSRPPAVDLDMGGAQCSAEILSRLHALRVAGAEPAGVVA